MSHAADEEERKEVAPASAEQVMPSMPGQVAADESTPPRAAEAQAAAAAEEAGVAAAERRRSASRSRNNSKRNSRNSNDAAASANHDAATAADGAVPAAANDQLVADAALGVVHALQPDSPDASSSPIDAAASPSASPAPPVDAAARAAADPVDPRVPAGQEPASEALGAGLHAQKEGQAQMDHENPSLAQVVGLESPPPAGSTGPEKARGIEGGTEGMSRAELQELVERFQPVVWLHEDERYLPVTVRGYLDGATLLYDPVGQGNQAQYITLKKSPADEDLTDAGLFALLDAYRTATADPRLANITVDNMVRRSFHMRVNGVTESYGVGDWRKVNQVPFYARVRKYADRYEILYVTMYAFNGPFMVCCQACDAHSADVEHITLRVSLDGQRLDWAYFGAHGRADGVWRRADKMDLLKADKPYGTRPQVYSSKGSHGVYPDAGLWCRICGFANDVTGGPAQGVGSIDVSTGKPYNAWDPEVKPVLLLDPLDARFDGDAQGGTKWLVYSGTMGEDGVDAIHGQGWWDGENEYQNNFFRRCLWPCRYLECNWPTPDCCYNACQSKVDFTSYSSVPPPPAAAAAAAPPPQAAMER
jgi:hypothetical protein